MLGLGNPGLDYEKHRHNIGFQLIDYLSAEQGIKLHLAGFLKRYAIGEAKIKGRSIWLAKPLTYMNRSGEVVKSILRQAKASCQDLLVVFDSLDLAVGQLRLKTSGSSGGHRGLESVLKSLKTESVPRLAIGIGRPPYKGQVVDYVLSPPSLEEARLLEKAIKQAANAIIRLLSHSYDKVMSELNRQKKLLNGKENLKTSQTTKN